MLQRLATTNVLGFHPKNSSDAWLRHQFFVHVYKAVMATSTSTCTFTPCLLQFPPMEVLNGVDRFLSLCWTINHVPVLMTVQLWFLTPPLRIVSSHPVTE